MKQTTRSKSIILSCVQATSCTIQLRVNHSDTVKYKRGLLSRNLVTKWIQILHGCHRLSPLCRRGSFHLVILTGMTIEGCRHSAGSAEAYWNGSLGLKKGVTCYSRPIHTGTLQTNHTISIGIQSIHMIQSLSGRALTLYFPGRTMTQYQLV